MTEKSLYFPILKLVSFFTRQKLLFYDQRHLIRSGQSWSLSNREINLSKAAKGADSGPGLFYSLRDVNAGHIQIILDMCNAGLLIDATTGSSPEWGGPAISQFLSIRPAIC